MELSTDNKHLCTIDSVQSYCSSFVLKTLFFFKSQLPDLTQAGNLSSNLFEACVVTVEQKFRDSPKFNGLPEVHMSLFYSLFKN